MSVEQILKQIQTHDVKFVDLRFTDLLGKEQHLSVPARGLDADFFVEGKMFDGSSIRGWRNISNSDMLLQPDASTAFIDPFYPDTTLIIRCDVLDPSTMAGYERDPRSIAKRAEAYLQSTGIADACYFGPEPEFFVFDDVRWKTGISGAFYSVDSFEAVWNSDLRMEGGNLGHRPQLKGGYFPVPPVDSSQSLRSKMCLTLEALGMQVEAHHHEVSTGNQNEISTRFNTLLNKADELMLLKYVVHNVAHGLGKSATFMPKPLVGDNGSGMHVHQSLAKAGHNLFAGDQYAGLSKEALFYIGGIIKHARALNAFTNPATNSYKRLVPGFEAPVLLAYSACNRSAAIRIPHVNSEQGRRIEVRFPDAMANPYLAFSAMMMAGLDGIQNQIHPGDAMDKNLYDLPKEDLVGVPTVCHALEQAVEGLQTDHEFLLAGDVFNEDMLDAYCHLLQGRADRLALATHPIEFEEYYSG